MRDLEINKLTEIDVIPYDLLYLADPSKEAVEDYLNRGIVYIGRLGKEIVGVYVLLPTRPLTVELVNLAVDEKFHKKGYGKQLVYHAIEAAKKGNYKLMELGTENSGIDQLALYQKCGFTICSVDFDFFRKYYADPIFENGIECRHMIRLKLDL